MNDVLHIESSSENDSDNNTLSLNNSNKNYVKKNDIFYPDVDLLFTSIKDKYLQLIFRDIDTKIPFCTLNIKYKID